MAALSAADNETTSARIASATPLVSLPVDASPMAAACQIVQEGVRWERGGMGEGLGFGMEPGSGGWWWKRGSFTTHYSLLTTHYPLLNTHYSLPIH